MQRPTDTADVTLTSIPVGFQAVGPDTLDVSIEAAPSGLSLLSDSLDVLTGPRMEVAADPVLQSWNCNGFDQGVGLALATSAIVTDLACDVQARLYNPVTRNAYVSAITSELTTHNLVLMVTDLADRGVNLQFAWRWWYDGRQSDGPWITLSSTVQIPAFGGDPTTNP